MDRLSEAILRSLPSLDQTSQCPRPPYEWTKLTDDTSNIRLLLLFPGKAGPLRCSVFEVPITATPDYEAISYHWGDPTPCRTLRIENHVLRIARSIYDALLRVRRWNQFRIIWIDGVCISQVDTSEKSEQILLMKQIFHRATTVLVYLGPEADDSESLPELFHRMVQAARQKGCKLGVGRDPDEHRLPVEQYTSFGLPAWGSNEWIKVRKFFSRSYFRRVWVIQEVVLSRDSHLICGKWVLPWSDFILCVYSIGQLGLPGQIEGNNTDAFELCMAIDRLRNEIRDSQSCKFAFLLRRLRYADSTDERDKLYAFLGLADSFGEVLPKPDYHKDKNTVYKQFARHLINQGDGYELLYSCFAEPSSDMPSWVPNWSSKGDPTNFAPVFDATHYQMKLTSIIGTSIQPKIYLEGKTEALHVDGWFFGSIKSQTTSQMPPAEGPDEWRIAVGNCAIELEELWKQRATECYPTGESRDEVLPRILRCDQRPKESPDFAPHFAPDFADTYRTFKTYCSAVDPEFRHWMDRNQILATAFAVEEIGLEKWMDVTEHSVSGFVNGCKYYCKYRRRCLTSQGLLGQVPWLAEVGDKIFLPHGCMCPFVVRRKETGYVIIGQCFIYGRHYLANHPTTTRETIRIV